MEEGDQRMKHAVVQRIRAGRSLLALALLLVIHVAGAAVRDPEEHFFDTTFGDFTEELQNAEVQGKKGILIMFEMDECPFCHRMKTTVLNQSEIQDYFKENFLIFPVDIEGDIEITDFSDNTLPQKDFALKQFRVRATPVFAFFDLDGNLVARYTGATSGPEEFLWLGEYVVQGAYKETTFTRYKRQRQQAAGEG
jgi:thioredoxin-related protein